MVRVLVINTRTVAFGYAKVRWVEEIFFRQPEIGSNFCNGGIECEYDNCLLLRQFYGYKPYKIRVLMRSCFAFSLDLMIQSAHLARWRLSERRLYLLWGVVSRPTAPTPPSFFKTPPV